MLPDPTESGLIRDRSIGKPASIRIALEQSGIKLLCGRPVSVKKFYLGGDLRHFPGLVIAGAVPANAPGLIEFATQRMQTGLPRSPLAGAGFHFHRAVVGQKGLLVVVELGP